MNTMLLFRVLASIDFSNIPEKAVAADEREAAGFSKIQRDVFFIDDLYAGRLLVQQVVESPQYQDGCDVAEMQNIIRTVLSAEKNFKILKWLAHNFRGRKPERVLASLIMAA